MGADWMSLEVSSAPHDALRLLTSLASSIASPRRKSSWLGSQSDRSILALSWMVQNSPCDVPIALRKAVLAEQDKRPAHEENRALFTKDGGQLDRQACQSPLAHPT